MTAEEMWKESGLSGYHEAWTFGEVPDKLLDLVKRGIKKATSSAYILYELGGDKVPAAGDYSIILDSKGEAGCIIQTRKVEIVPFKEVSAEFAAKEGEGDLSLEYWRDVHRDFFTFELSSAGKEFNEDTLVVCEEFELIKV